MATASDAGKVTTREGLGGPVVKEAIAQAPQGCWVVMKRDFGTWMEVAPAFDTEEKALALVSTMKEGGSPLELMVVNRSK